MNASRWFRAAAVILLRTPSLPAQAIVQDKDTWIDGGLGFPLDRNH